MDGWCDFAENKKLDYPNWFPNRWGHAIKAVCLHIADGPLTAVRPTFNVNGGSSAHFCIGKDGTIEQYVALTDGAWANGLTYSNGVWLNPRGVKVQPTWSLLEPWVNPNLQTVSIEHEGQSGEPLTPAMIEAQTKLLKWIAAETGLVYEAGTTLIGHFMLDTVDRVNCPGSGFNLVEIATRASV